MRWKHVGVIYVVLALLIGYTLLFDRAQPPEAIDPTEAVYSLLGADASSVTSVTFRREDTLVHAARDAERWRTVEPTGAQISPDLFDATIATLTAGQASEKLSYEPEASLSAYGLDAPSATVEVVMLEAPGQPITILIGARNPTHTAVYARRSDQAAIFLVGMNLSYYIDLVFEAAKTHNSPMHPLE